MNSDTQLEESLREYEQQLQSVEASLAASNDEQKTDLLELKSNLLEVIILTRESLSVKNASIKIDSSTSQQKSDIDSEFTRFQAEIAELDTEADNYQISTEDNCNASTEDIKELIDDELAEISSKLEGSKCKAPFGHEWGEKDYYNAIILSLEVENVNVTSYKDLEVRVLFCNPVCDAMRPCPYFLEGQCKFSDDKCRFSHGNIVKLSDLQDFANPDYSLLQKDSLCLAKYSNDLWYKAKIEHCFDDHKYLIKYLQYNETEIVNIEDILPYSDPHLQNDDSESDGEFAKDLQKSDHWYPTDPTARQFGEWEKYTKGFGSRIMAQMGYKWGEGLGKTGEGRTEPVDAMVLPRGKSLDKCIEIRELSGNKDHFSVIKKLKSFQKKNTNTISKSYKKTVPKKNVFDFINSKVGFAEGSRASKDLSNKISKTVISTNLNVHALQVSENIKKTEKELNHLQQALNRNKNKDKIIQEQLEKRIIDQKIIMKSLKDQEKLLYKQQKMQKDNNKLTIF